jgi:hypothetical protein
MSNLRQQNLRWKNLLMANESKKILTSEITDWLQNAIANTGDPAIIQVFGDRKYTSSDYFTQPDSLRLRSAGFQLLKMYFEHEEFKHDRPFYTGEILTLSTHMSAPFYINRDKITLFSNENMVMCKMAGSVALWLNNFY